MTGRPFADSAQRSSAYDLSKLWFPSEDGEVTKEVIVEILTQIDLSVDHVQDRVKDVGCLEKKGSTTAFKCPLRAVIIHFHGRTVRDAVWGKKQRKQENKEP